MSCRRRVGEVLSSGAVIARECYTEETLIVLFSYFSLSQ